MRTDAQQTYKSLMIVRPFLSKHKFPTYIISHSPHPVNRRAAGVKIAGAVLTKLYFRSRVLYLVGKGKQKISKAGSYENSQKYFTQTPAVLTMLYFRSRVLYFDGMGKEKIPKAGPTKTSRNILHERQTKSR